jgi:histidyl-tRNA synthetase
MFNRIKGTQDFLDLTLFNFLIGRIEHHLRIYNFTQIKTPILEPLELFKRSLGLETDVVNKEMYTVNPSSPDEIICLRPEGTASIVRAFVNNGITQVPWKVWAWGSMFRHERPQKGRYRQFYQITMEIIGSDAVAQDAHFIKMLDRFFYEVLTLDTYALLINFLGCAEDRTAFKTLLYHFLNGASDRLCATCLDRKEKNIMRIFDCKNPSCQEFYKQAPHIADHLCHSCSQEWTGLKDNLEHLSVSYSYVPTLVRGLDYYDKTVFEFVSSSLGAQNAFCSGGRYNQLARIIGSREDQPSIGAAIGIERMLLMLDSIKQRLELPEVPPLYLIVPLSVEQHPLALLLSDELQAHNLRTDILLEGDSLKSMMRKADKLGAHSCLLLGSNEQATHTIMVKNMVTGGEQTIAQSRIVQFLTSQ